MSKKRMGRIVSCLTAHLTIALALAFAAFIVLDWFNPFMAFTSNAFSTVLLGVFCATSLATAIGSISRSFRDSPQMTGQGRTSR